MASTPEFEPGPLCWEASALTTAPFLAPFDDDDDDGNDDDNDCRSLRNV